MSDAIKADCPDEYAQYKQTVQEYARGMRENVEAYGCGVVSAYGVFAEIDMDRIEQWEDHSQEFETVNDVFLLAKRYKLSIASNPVLFDAIRVLLGNKRERLFDQIDQLFSYASQYELRRMNKEPERLLYLMWAMRIDTGKMPRHIFRTAKHLRREFPLKTLVIALILDEQITKVYPEYSVKKRLKLIQHVFHTYSKTFMTKFIANALALPNLVYLLPPQPEDIHGSQDISNARLTKLQRDYAGIIKQIVKTFEVATNGNFGIAIDSTAVLAPYIQQALMESSAMSITAYLKAQIESPVFERYLNQQGSCNETDFSTYVAMFFTFLAPHKQDEESHKPVPINYLQNNLSKIAYWYSRDEHMRAWVVDQKNAPKAFIQNIAWLPYYYEQLSPRSREYMSKLLLDLPGSINTNASFILALKQGSDYFEWINDAPDADEIVDANEDVGDNSVAKYRYILTTPFPAQDDASVFQRFISGGKDIPAISSLERSSVDELSTHEFTKSEKYQSMANAADNVFTVAMILATPVTGGASLTYVGAKIALKLAAKKGIKYGMRVGYRYVRKTASKNIVRTTQRLTGKEGKQAFIRESKELAGLAPKRGRPSLYAKGQSTMKKTITRGDQLSSRLQLGLIAVPVATMLYCAKFSSTSSSLCQTQAEASPVNQCMHFKGEH